MQALIKVGSTQHLVQSGDKILIPRQAQEPEAIITLDQVLLIANGDQTLLGQPLVAKASVSAKILKHVSGPKIRVFKFKAKSRYRKTRGFRSKLTQVQIESIHSPSVKTKS